MNLPALVCGGCRACCIGDKVEIRPDLGDQHKRWKTEFDPATGKRFLKRGPDGNCVYLGAKGCTIHGRQPAACRRMDCRRHFLDVMKVYGEAGYQARIATGMTHLAEGRRRVEELRAAASPTP